MAGLNVGAATIDTPLGQVSRDRLGVFLLVFLVGASLALATNHVWEDFYTAYRSSKNLATGNGLVYNPGERVMTFTSPLNTLTAALFSLLLFNSSDQAVIWLHRILSLVLLGVSAVWLYDATVKAGYGRTGVGVCVGLYTTNIGVVDFSINGQETGFMLFFLALALHTLTARNDRVCALLTCSLAGLMWTRTDGFVYFGCIALGYITFIREVRFTDSRRVLVGTLVRSAMWAGLLYLPWFAFSIAYYQTPIPHSIVAKGLDLSPDFAVVVLNLLYFIPAILLEETSALSTFGPVYFYMGGWGEPVSIFARVLGTAAALYWLIPAPRCHGRAASLAFLCSHFYLTHIANMVSPWYLPNTAILGVLAVAGMVAGALARARDIGHEKPKTAARLSIASLVVYMLSHNLYIFAASGYQLRLQQELVETKLRKNIGLWLHENAEVGDSVFLEPVGYIGYFSQLKTYDYPGITSPEVVAARKKIGTNQWERLIEELRPDWVVRRPFELSDQYMLTAYDLVAVGDVTEEIEAQPWLPGRNYLLFDRLFAVYKRKGDRLQENNVMEYIP